MTRRASITIVVDTREQLPWQWPDEPDVTVVRHCLKAGDYSVAGFEAELAIERKSLEDFVGSLTWGRARFDRALVRLRERRWHCIIVESDWHVIAGGDYRSNVQPTCLIGSVAAIVADGTPVLFASSRWKAQTLALRLLRKFHKRAVAQRDVKPDNVGFGA